MHIPILLQIHDLVFIIVIVCMCADPSPFPLL